jgi:high-affinity Fe2+/Pb2+ permease
MSQQTSQITTIDNWKPKVLIIGGVIGAAVGITAAYLLTQRGGEEGPPEISAGEGVKLGVLVFGLLRSIANL